MTAVWYKFCNKKNCISIVINGKLLIKTENNGIAVNIFDEKMATVAYEICM
jgi:hypothetical protein